MANKLGKFLLFAAAAGAAAAGAYYYLQKKENASKTADETDETFENFEEEVYKEEDSTRNYVPLNFDSAPAEAVEEFFDEEDPADAEPVIPEN